MLFMEGKLCFLLLLFCSLFRRSRRWEAWPRLWQRGFRSCASRSVPRANRHASTQVFIDHTHTHRHTHTHNGSTSMHSTFCNDRKYSILRLMKQRSCQYKTLRDVWMGFIYICINIGVPYIFYSVCPDVFAYWPIACGVNQFTGQFTGLLSKNSLNPVLPFFINPNPVS